jgi:hypothetical protein
MISGKGFSRGATKSGTPPFSAGKPKGGNPNTTDGNPWIVQIQPALLSRYLFMTNVVNRFSEAKSHI